jgi:hypothetical protein
MFVERTSEFRVAEYLIHMLNRQLSCSENRIVKEELTISIKTPVADGDVRKLVQDYRHLLVKPYVQLNLSRH